MIRVGVIGTGGMATTHGKAYTNDPRVKIVAACDLDSDKLARFASTFGVERTYRDMSEMLDAGGLDAVSIVTPDATHARLAIQALEGGLHVLSEKPLATNHKDALRMVEAARKARRINMVNFSYRNSSAIHRAAAMVQNGDLGRIYHVEARYLQSWLVSQDWGNWRETPTWLWRLSSAHGSKGVLGDVGVHILDFACYPVGPVKRLRCELKTFDKAPGDRIGEYQLDANDSAYINVEFANGAMGSIITTRYAQGHQNSVNIAIHGEKAALRIDLDRSYRMMEVSKLDDWGKMGPWEYLDCGHTPTIYERFINSIESGENDQPDFAEGAHIQSLLDACQVSSAEGCRNIDIAAPPPPSPGPVLEA